MVLYDVVYNAQPLSVSVYLSVIESVCLSVVPPISKGRARGSALALEVERFVDTLERELYGGLGLTLSAQVQLKCAPPSKHPNYPITKTH